MFGIKTKIKKKIDRFLDHDVLKKLRLYPSGIACNHECIMCWIQQLSIQDKRSMILNNQKNTLSLDDYKNLIQSLPRSIKIIELVGGGEPLLFSHIDELMKIIKNRKYLGILITNGALLTEPIRQTIINSRWDYIRVSFHSGTAKTYKNIHGRDDFTLVVNNIKELLKKRKNNLPYVKLLFVIQKANYHELNSFIELAENLGVDEIEFDYLIPGSKRGLFLSKNEMNVVKKYLNTTNTRLKNNIDSVKQMLSSNAWSNIQNRKKDYFIRKFCILNSLEINQTGATTPCCLLWNSKLNKKLNIKTTDVKDIWKFYKSFRLNLRKGKFSSDCIKHCYYKLNELAF